MSDLVCPECGNEYVTATLTTRTEYRYAVGEGTGLLEVEASEVDGGDLDEADTFVCTDCGIEWDSPETEWITREAFDKTQEPCEECDGRGYYNCWPHTTCPTCEGSGRAIQEED